MAGSRPETPERRRLLRARARRALQPGRPLSGRPARVSVTCGRAANRRGRSPFRRPRSALPERTTRLWDSDAHHPELLDGRRGNGRLRASGANPCASYAPRGARRARRRQGEHARRHPPLRPPHQLHVPPAHRDRGSGCSGCRRALPFSTCRSRCTTRCSRGTASRSSPIAAHNSCSGKLVWFYSGWLEDDLDLFDPPMD